MKPFSVTLASAAVWWTLSASPVHALRHLQFASPLQALTIPDHEDNEVDTVPPTARGRYLQKIQAGLKAEKLVKDKLSQEQEAIAVDTSKPDWAQKASVNIRRNQLKEQRMLEAAFDKAVAPFEEQFKQIKKQTSQQQQNKYQIVGVIQSNPAKSNGKVIQWYARPKPSNSKWSVRLVHIDIFGRYENTGSTDAETGLPVVRSQYVVRERSWKNLWNFSPKHFFYRFVRNVLARTTSTGGLYTDGNTVYESSYRYRDGRNGMHRVSSFAQFLKSPTFPDKMKLKVQERLKKDSPDIVLEE